MIDTESKWYSTPKAARRRKPIGVTLSDAAQARLERMARRACVSRSQIVESLIMGASLRAPKGTP